MMKVALFRLGNVLAFLNREKAYRKIAEHVPHDMEDVQQRIEASGLIEQVNANSLEDARFFIKLMNLFDPPHTLEFSDFYQIWGDVYTTNRGLLKFLGKMRKDIILVLMADLSVIEVESFVQKHVEVLQPFADRVIYTSEENLSVQDNEFFARAVEKSGPGNSFENVLYIDSDRENVTAATQLGMKGHHYVGLLEFVNQLKQLNLLA